MPMRGPVIAFFEPSDERPKLDAVSFLHAIHT
jgi:hypothetical protein